MTPAAAPPLLRTLLGTLVRPQRTFESLATQTKSSPGAAAMALLGMLWGLLCFLLWSARIEAPAVLLPIPAREYYLWQGLLMLPIVTGLWWIFGEIAHRLAHGEGSEPATRTALGFAYALPMMVHVLVEILLYLISGHDALADVARVSLPLAAIWVWVLSALALRAVHRVSTGRAIFASFAGLLAQAVAGALVLR